MLGLIGLGKIGTQVAKIGKAFGMEVCAWSENLNLSHANEIEFTNEQRRFIKKFRYNFNSFSFR